MNPIVLDFQAQFQGSVTFRVTEYKVQDVNLHIMFFVVVWSPEVLSDDIVFCVILFLFVMLSPSLSPFLPGSDRIFIFCISYVVQMFSLSSNTHNS